MGSGKSTLGKKIAQKLDMPFYDLDAFIENQENKSISSIFESQGEEAFREMETKYLKQLIKNEVLAVIALGGGTLAFNNTIELIKSAGLLIYIELPPAALIKRLKASRDSRPLLKFISENELPEFIHQLLDERKKFYEQAHLKIRGINLKPENLIHEIKSLL